MNSRNPMFQPDEDWNNATPQDIPPPTYWPAILALGTTFVYWGFVTTFIMSIAGVVIFIVALAGWISDLRDDVTSNNQTESSNGS